MLVLCVRPLMSLSHTVRFFLHLLTYLLLEWNFDIIQYLTKATVLTAEHAVNEWKLEPYSWLIISAHLIFAIISCMHLNEYGMFPGVKELCGRHLR